MAKPVRNTVTGIATSNPVPLSTLAGSPFNVTLGVYGGSGCTYTIQFTLDDVFAPGYDPATGKWIDHPDATAQTGDTVVMLVAPVTAVRLNQTAGATASTFFVCQSGNME
jgi:hypothetical protein